MEVDLRSLLLVLTDRCNLACRYCYQDRGRGGRMSGETLVKALEFASRAPGREVEVVFYGGEPLLEVPLIRKALERADTLSRPEKRVRFAVVTNGLLLDEEVLSLLVEKDVEVQLSFDGHPAAQSLRGERSFPVLDRLLRSLRCKYPEYLTQRVEVVVTVIPETVRYLDASVAYLLEQGVERIALTPTLTDSSGWKEEDAGDLRRRFQAVGDLLVAGFLETGSMPFREFLAVGIPARGGMLCEACRGESLTVDTDGEVYACAAFLPWARGGVHPSFHPDLESMHLGPLGSETLLAALRDLPERLSRSTLFSGRGRKVAGERPCAACRYRPDCDICPAAIARFPGNRDPDRIPAFICRFNREWLDCRRGVLRCVRPLIHRLSPSAAPSVSIRSPDELRRS